jgi:hypothetical protein
MRALHGRTRGSVNEILQINRVGKKVEATNSPARNSISSEVIILAACVMLWQCLNRL